MKSDLNSICSNLNISVTDSANDGVWRYADMKNNSATLSAAPANASASGLIIPDVKGMGLKDAVYLLENKGFIVTVSGKGKVVNQLPAATTIFKKGQNISLILN